MSEQPVDYLTDLRRHLSRQVNAQLQSTGAASVYVHRAVYEHGWDVKALAAECMRNHNGAINPAGIVMKRLEIASNNPPAEATQRRSRRPLCGQCEDGWRVDPGTRLPVNRCDCRTAEVAS